MPINKLRIENFKGVRDQAEFDIKPITLFIGPNSSGKSSCIHALAALSQTVKLPNSGRPLVLDDEFAQVHLGRFIEVIHSKSYTDAISIGFDTVVGDRSLIRAVGTRLKKLLKSDAFAVDYSFKSTRRTQDVYLDRAEYRSGNASLTFKMDQKKTAFTVKAGNKTLDFVAPNDSSLSPRAYLPRKETDDSIYELLFMNDLGRQIINAELTSVLYLGPFRQSPLRRYPTRGSSPTEVGAQGENTITLLANEFVQTKTRPHLREVGKWLSALGLAKSVELARLGSSDLFDVKVKLADGANLPIADLGYGMSQVLPVLAQCSFAPRGATLLFEQPELHLHPTAAHKMASVLVEAQASKGLHIVAETHSSDLFFGLLEEVRQGRFELANLVAYKVKRVDGQSQFAKIEIEQDADGSIDVLDPWQTDL